IALVGEAWCFVADAVSYLAVVAALLLLRVPPRPPDVEHGPVLRRLAEGFTYAFGFRPIRAILLLLAVVSLLGTPYRVLLPVFAADVLGGGAPELGLLTAASGLGALAGALYLASRPTVLGLGRLIVLGALVLGLGLSGLAGSRGLWAALAMLVL